MIRGITFGDTGGYLRSYWLVAGLQKPTDWLSLAEGHCILLIQLSFIPSISSWSSHNFQLHHARRTCVGKLWVHGCWLTRLRQTCGLLAALFLFEMSAHLMGQSYNGISETVCAGWFPMTLWALIRMMERPSFKRALAWECWVQCVC